MFNLCALEVNDDGKNKHSNLCNKGIQQIQVLYFTRRPHGNATFLFWEISYSAGFRIFKTNERFQ